MGFFLVDPSHSGKMQENNASRSNTICCYT